MRVRFRSAAAAAALLSMMLILQPASPSLAQDPAVAADPMPEPGQGEIDVAALERHKGIAGKTLDKIKDVARQAGDILARVPCLPPKGGAKSIGALPHVAHKLADGRPVVIVAFGSSSTQGYGSSSPAFNYPNRLAAQLRRHYPGSTITVINSGVGGEDARDMMKRLKTTVLDAKPDLVIWQVGTNAILHDLAADKTASLVEEGISVIQASQADVVLVDPQYAPRVNERGENASKTVKLLGRLAELRRVGIFPRFEVMKEWHEQHAMPFDKFVIADGLHMNDWGYACFAQLLGDGIIRSVGQIKLGTTAAPGEVTAYRPM
ncbi:SGNH/GDSL hydrolase family protein [Rhodopseudomonas parapalustris]